MLADLGQACQEATEDGTAPLFEALAMFLADSCVDRDESSLDAIRTGAQRLLGQVRRERSTAPFLEGPFLDGRLRSLIDVAHWGLERSLPAEFTVELDRESHAFRVLEVIAIRPGTSNQDIAAFLNLHESEVSRAGRRLIAYGLANKRKLGRINRWEVSPRGTEVLRIQRSSPPLVDVFAKLFDTLMVRHYVDNEFSEEDLISQTEIAPSAVRPAVQRLVDMGYLQREPDSGGTNRRATLRVNPHRGCAVGVSILRHEVRAVLTDAHAREVDTKSHPLPHVTAEGKVSEVAVVQAIGEMLDEWRSKVQILGVGAEVAGHVGEHGVVRLSPPLRWEEVPLRGMLYDRLGGLPVVVENDANVLAIYQQRFGEAGGRMRSFAVVMITPRGEGIGSGLILNSELYRGSEGGAGEIGHYTVRPTGGRKCRCGRRGCLEAEVGVESMVAKVRRARHERQMELPDVAALAAAGEESAVKAIRYAGTMMGRGISFLMNTVDLEGVVLSGPPELCNSAVDRSESAEIFLGSLCREAQSRLYPTLRGALSMEKIINTMPFTDIDRACGAASVLLDAIAGRQAGHQEMRHAMLAAFTGQEH
ncbi:MAG TPA: ROK family transcriptional regulator [Streptosporangiaceae bacterium]|nr:ROK family transcriptional regulator [Streptosporangiaceae bacterium]